MKNTRRYIPLALGLALALMLFLGLLQPVRAADITVTTTMDVLDAAGSCGAVTVASLPGPDGETSMREAICAANNNTVPDTIQFAILGCGSGCTIQPDIALPVLTGDDTTIDGYTQAGTSPATDTEPATLLVELDGSSIASNNGINITSSRNVIRGLVINRFSLNGIAIGGSEATDNVISGNYIGTDASGIHSQDNGFDGVFIGLGAQRNTIGGDEPAERNIISGNDLVGVGIHGSSTMSNTVSGNYIGVAADGLYDCANGFHGVHIYGGSQHNIIGGDNEGERNVISGNTEDGVRIEGEETTGNVVSGNYIGVDTTGATGVPNHVDGVMIRDAPGNLIGGDTPGERNVISGNDENGVHIDGATASGNIVSGNYIGTDESGTEALGNGDNGVRINNAHNNLIGGDTEGERNVISGNGNDGVQIINDTTGNVVSGNYIGVDATGATALPNLDDGVQIFLGSDNLIGGDAPGERNVISGNVEDGVRIAHRRATGNVVSGNYIGVNASGVTVIPNGLRGVYIDWGARNNIIGGTTEGQRNVITGNSYGVWIEGDELDLTTGNTILGNYIGPAADGVTPLGNTNDGVHLSFHAQNNSVGPDNVIAHNSGDGVGVDTPMAFGNTITQNAIFANGGLGIHLTNGANNGIAAPVISSAPSGPGDIAGTAFPGSTVELFASHDADGEGEVYLGSTTANGAGDYVLTVSSLPYPYLTATATDPDDGTSELSTVFTAEIPVLHAGSDKTVDRESASPGEALTYTLTLSNKGTSNATATLTDTLPSEVIWANNASASSGALTWESENNRLLWSGTVEVDTMVVITFQVRVNADLSNGETISNTAVVNDGANNIFDIIAPDVTVVVHYLYLPLVMR